MGCGLQVWAANTPQQLNILPTQQ